MSPSATASSGGVRGGGGGGGGAASWGRETAALARRRACLLGELISSLGEGAEASRRPSGPSTIHGESQLLAWAPRATYNTRNRRYTCRAVRRAPTPSCWTAPQLPAWTGSTLRQMTLRQNRRYGRDVRLAALRLPAWTVALRYASANNAPTADEKGRHGVQVHRHVGASHVGESLW